MSKKLEPIKCPIVEAIKNNPSVLQQAHIKEGNCSCSEALYLRDLLAQIKALADEPAFVRNRAATIAKILDIVDSVK